MTDTENNTLPAAEIIEALGGIRPLAKRMGLTPSTVQGWKQRDSIPSARMRELMALAKEDGVSLYAGERESATVHYKEDRRERQDDRRSPASGHSNEKARRFADGIPIKIPNDRRNFSDRRHGWDRRKRIDPNYAGPERRTGADRRTGLDRRRRQVIWQTKWNFVERMIMSMAVLYMIIVSASLVVMKPEYDKARERSAQVAAMEKRLNDMGIQLTDLQRKEAIESRHYAGALNRKIEELENRTDQIARTVRNVGKLGEMAVGSRLEKLESRYNSLDRLMTRVDNMTEAGEKAQLEQSVSELQGIIRSLRGDVDQLDSAVSEARQRDQELARLLQDVSRQDLTAAAMLLALGQFRESVGSGRPFDDDLQIIRDLVGNNPELQAALDQLVPYAEDGVLSHDALKREFGGLTNEILNAALAGEELSFGDRAAHRLGSLVTVTKDGERILTPNHPVTNIVNRAHQQIEAGDLRGAVQTLQQLEGPAARSAEKWAHQARAAIIAGDTNALLSNSMLNALIPRSLTTGGGGTQLSPGNLERFLQRNFLDPMGVPRGGRDLNLQWDPTRNTGDRHPAISYD